MNKRIALPLFLLVLFAPSLSLAAGAPFEIPAGDKSLEVFLNALFGPLVGGSDAGSNPLGPMFGVLNGVVLSVAGVMVAYQMLAGTLATAHEGEVLGRRWSSMWIPLRISIGASLLMPMSSGFNAIQVVVMWLAMQGIGAADIMWNTFADSSVTDSSYVAPDMTAQARQLAARMLVLQACRNGYQLEQGLDQERGWFGKLVSGDYVQEVAPTPTDGGQGVSYGPCGSTYQKTSAQIASDAGIDMSDTGTALSNARQVAAGLWPIHAQQLARISSDAQALAKSLGPDSQDAVNAYLDKEATSYTQALNAALTSGNQAQMNQDIITAMKKDGWMMAGAYYMQISSAQDQLTQAISAFPSVSVGSVDAQDLHDDAKHSMLWASKFVEDGMKAHQTGLGADSDRDSGLMDKALTWFTQGKGTDLSSPDKINSNPLLRAKQMGNSLITWAWSTYGVAVGAGGVGGGILAGNAAGKLAGADTAFTAAVMMLTPVLFSLAMSLLVAGVGMAAYLPMVPYIIYLGAVIGFFILLLEALIAAPLWILAHIAPDGDGFVGRGGQGYMLVLSLMLKPALIVLGLCASIVMMKPIGYLITSTFAPVFNISVIQNSGWGGLTITVAGCIIFYFVLLSAVKRVFGLIHIVPDQVMRWLGGVTGTALGGHAQGMEAHTRGGQAAMLGAVTGLGSSLAAGTNSLRNGKSGKGGRDDDLRDASERSSRRQQAQLDALNDAKAGRRERDAGNAPSASPSSSSTPNPAHSDAEGGTHARQTGEGAQGAPDSQESAGGDSRASSEVSDDSDTSAPGANREQSGPDLNETRESMPEPQQEQKERETGGSGDRSAPDSIQGQSSRGATGESRQLPRDKEARAPQVEGRKGEGESLNGIGISKTTLPKPEQDKQDNGGQEGAREISPPVIDKKLIDHASGPSSSPASGEGDDGEGDVD